MRGDSILRPLYFPLQFLRRLFLFHLLLNMTVLNISFMTAFFLRFSQNIRTLLLNTLQIAVQNLQNVVCLPFFVHFLIAFRHFILFCEATVLVVKMEKSAFSCPAAIFVQSWKDSAAICENKAVLIQSKSDL